MTILLDPINRKPIYDRSPFLIRDMIWLSGSEGPHCVRDGRQGDNQPTVNDNRIAMDKERKTRATDPFILSRTNPPGTSSSYQSTTLFGHFPSNQSTNGFPTRGITSDGCPIFECRLFPSALFKPVIKEPKRNCISRATGQNISSRAPNDQTPTMKNSLNFGWGSQSRRGRVFHSPLARSFESRDEMERNHGHEHQWWAEIMGFRQRLIACLLSVGFFYHCFSLSSPSRVSLSIPPLRHE
jgi:hypothetical protein